MLPVPRVVIRAFAQSGVPAGYYAPVAGVTMNMAVYCRVPDKKDAMVFDSPEEALNLANTVYRNGWLCSLEKVENNSGVLRTTAVPVGLKDRLGNDLCLGDIVEFDGEEWGAEDGAPQTFTLKLEKGDLVMFGAPGDADQYWTLVGHDWREVRMESYR